MSHGQRIVLAGAGDQVVSHSHFVLASDTNVNVALAWHASWRCRLRLESESARNLRTIWK